MNWKLVPLAIVLTLGATLASCGDAPEKRKGVELGVSDVTPTLDDSYMAPCRVDGKLKPCRVTPHQYTVDVEYVQEEHKYVYSINDGGNPPYILDKWTGEKTPAKLENDMDRKWPVFIFRGGGHVTEVPMYP